MVIMFEFLKYLKPYESPRSSGALIFGMPVYGHRNKNLGKFLMWVNRGPTFIAEFMSNVRLHTTQRSAWTVKMPYAAWWDEDQMILHSCFIILERYISFHGELDKFEEWSKELIVKPDGNAPEGVHKSQGDNQMTAIELYRWWKIDRPARHAAHSKEMMWLFGHTPKAHRVENLAERRNAYYKEEEAIDEEDQRMLHKLIDIRHSIWI